MLLAHRRISNCQLPAVALNTDGRSVLKLQQQQQQQPEHVITQQQQQQAHKQQYNLEKDPMDIDAASQPQQQQQHDQEEAANAEAAAAAVVGPMPSVSSEPAAVAAAGGLGSAAIVINHHSQQQQQQQEGAATSPSRVIALGGYMLGMVQHMLTRHGHHHHHQNHAPQQQQQGLAASAVGFSASAAGVQGLGLVMSARFGLLVRGLLGQVQRQKLDWKNLLAAALKNTVSYGCKIVLCYSLFKCSGRSMIIKLWAAALKNTVSVMIAFRNSLFFLLLCREGLAGSGAAAEAGRICWQQHSRTRSVMAVEFPLLQFVFSTVM
jgi:hypothetical protein